MELKIVNFEQANALRDIGFPQSDEYTDRYLYSAYDHDAYVYGEGDKTLNVGYLIDTYQEDIWTADENVISAPTLELVAKWLREEKGIHLYIKYLYDTSIVNNHPTYVYYYGTSKSGEIYCAHLYDSYESALSAGIDEAIRLVKQEKEKIK